MPLHSNYKRSRASRSSSSSSSNSDVLENKLKYRRKKSKSVGRKRLSSYIDSRTSKKAKLDSNKRISKSRHPSEHSDSSIASYTNESRDRKTSNFSQLSRRGQEFGYNNVYEKMYKKTWNYNQDMLPEDDPNASRTLYIGNLDINITCSELHTILEDFGYVMQIYLRLGKFGTDRMYAFAKFLTLDMAYNAKVSLSGQYITKFKCNIGYANSIATSRVWIGGLESSTTTSQIIAEFDKYGEIIEIDRVGDTQCYIRYNSVSAASKAKTRMRGFSFPDSKCRLRIDFADRSSSDLENHWISSIGSHNSKHVKALKNSYTVHDIIENSLTVWRGDLVLKSLPHSISIRLIEGNKNIVKEFMKPSDELTVSQEYNQSEFKSYEVRSGLSRGSSYAIFLGSSASKTKCPSVCELVSYLKKKKTVGVCYLMKKRTNTYGLIFILPPCSFSNDLLKRNCPNLSEESITDDYLIMVALRGY